MVDSPHVTEECSSCSRTLGACHFQKLGADIEEALGGCHSDFTITVQCKAYPLHRCVLAARCRFFRQYFDDLGSEESKTELDLGKVANLERVGQEAFVAVIKYVYGGRARLLGNAVTCLDDTCSHEACNPVVEYVQDVLRTAAVFDLPELKVHAEQHLISLVEKVPGDYLTNMMKVAKAHGAQRLYNCCLEVLANQSNWNYRSLENALGKELATEIKDVRGGLGLLMPTEDKLRDKQAWQVQKALDSGDVELVQMLMREGQFNFDDVHGLHYAAGHCDRKIVRELLDLKLSDPNVRDDSGYTVLHIACIRREPEILAGVLAKGAKPNDKTPDGRTGPQIVKRLSKNDGGGGGGIGSAAEEEEEAQRARLCLEILEQAEINTNIPYSKSYLEVINMAITTEKELVQKLLYLENRVGLAGILFPREAQIVKSLARLESTSEFTVQLPSSVAPATDRVQATKSPLFSSRGEPPRRFPVTGNYTKVEGAEVGLDANLLKRANALQKTVELGHRFFPRCSATVDKYMDDGMDELTTLDQEEQSWKKQRLDELMESLTEALSMDVVELDQQKGSKKLPPSLSSGGGSRKTRSPQTKKG